MDAGFGAPCKTRFLATGRSRAKLAVPQGNPRCAAATLRTKCPKEPSRHCLKLGPTSPVGPQFHCTRVVSKLRTQSGPRLETKCLGLQKVFTKICLSELCTCETPPCPGFSQSGCVNIQRLRLTRLQDSLPMDMWKAVIHICLTQSINCRKEIWAKPLGCSLSSWVKRDWVHDLVSPNVAKPARSIAKK